MDDNKMEEKEFYNKVLLEIFEEISLENFLWFKAILKRKDPLFKNMLLAHKKAFEEYIQVGCQ